MVEKVAMTLLDEGRISSAARIYKDNAEIMEEQAEYEKAAQLYEKAAKLHEKDNGPS